MYGVLEARGPGFDSQPRQIRKTPQLEHAIVGAMVRHIARWKREVLGSIPRDAKFAKSELDLPAAAKSQKFPARARESRRNGYNGGASEA